jgi:predicted tellurium resistance membrane protein TerC
MLDLFIPFLSLSLMEIALGIDNLIVISILVDDLPKAIREKARLTGIACALGFRVAFLFCLTLLIQAESHLFTFFGKPWSMRDLCLGFGGLFLIYKGTKEIHERLEAPVKQKKGPRKRNQFLGAVLQILLLDFVFSLDSMITAIGMVHHLGVMIVSMITAMLVMAFGSRQVSNIIQKRPSLKILAFSFLLLIGISLVAESLNHPIPKIALYLTMGFSIGTELIIQLSEQKHRRRRSKT